jgi:NADH-quinone oxidoreductase subunit G
MYTPGCCGKTTVWMFGNEIQRVTGRKDDHEVEDLFVTLVVLTKNTDWVIEGPRKFDKDSVINQNNYTRELDTVHIATEEGILKVRARP